MSRRLLITGSREWTDERTLAFALGHALGQLSSLAAVGWPVLVHGAARGADTMAAELWSAYDLPVEAHPADWDTHGKRAGFVRNAEMVALGADLCLAFIRAGSRGATMTADLAERSGIRTIRYRQE